MTTRKTIKILHNLFYTVSQFEKEYVCLDFLYFKVLNFDYANMGKMLIDSPLEKNFYLKM